MIFGSNIFILILRDNEYVRAFTYIYKAKPLKSKLFKYLFYEQRRPILCMTKPFTILLKSIYTGDENREHFLKELAQLDLTHVMQLKPNLLGKHIFQQCDAAHPENLPKQLEHGLENPFFFVIQVETHASTSPNKTSNLQFCPQSSNAIFAIAFWFFQIFLSVELQDLRTAIGPRKI